MKKIVISFATLCLIIAVTSCREQKSTGEKVEDAVEEMGDAVEDGAEEIEDAVEDATDDN